MPVNDTTDPQLLRDFAERRVEAAFEEIVRRHVDLVYSAARRLVVDPHLAEDVTQAVFAALAQQAAKVVGKLDRGMPLSGWLHVTTRNVAAKAVRTEVRRRAREQEAAAMHELSSAEDAAVWDQIAPHLDHALAELPEPDRNVLLLRFFERKTAREIGQRLGLKEEAAQKRITRALECLRELFVTRGVALTPTALVGILVTNAVQASPVALAGGIAKAVFTTSAITATPACLATSSAKLVSSLAMTKTQTAALVALTAALTVPLGFQQLTLNRLRARIATGNAPAQPAVVTTAEATPVVSSRPESEAEQIARLRRLADELRAKLMAKRTQAAAALDGPKLDPGPTFLAAGRSVPMSQLVFAGNATPEAALQSSLAFQRDGDIDGLTSLMLFPPALADKWNELLASPEQRENLAQEMAEAAQGVVMESAVEINEDQSASEPRVTKKWPENPQGIATVEVLEKLRIDDHRIRFSLKIVRGSDTKTDTPMLGLTSTGWKLLNPL
jgi:RNA polymerase sigma factor (sigma-70 family)